MYYNKYCFGILIIYVPHLPPSRCTYGKSDPLSIAQEQVLGSVQVPLQLHPMAFEGSFTLLETLIELQYVKPETLEI